MAGEELAAVAQRWRAAQDELGRLAARVALLEEVPWRAVSALRFRDRVRERAVMVRRLGEEFGAVAHGLELAAARLAEAARVAEAAAAGAGAGSGTGAGTGLWAGAGAGVGSQDRPVARSGR